jgi:hypothetical protein
VIEALKKDMIGKASESALGQQLPLVSFSFAPTPDIAVIAKAAIL